MKENNVTVFGAKAQFIDFETTFWKLERMRGRMKIKSGTLRESVRVEELRRVKFVPHKS